MMMSDTVKAWLLSGGPERALDRVANSEATFNHGPVIAGVLYCDPLTDDTVRKCLYPPRLTVEQTRAGLVAYASLAAGRKAAGH